MPRRTQLYSQVPWVGGWNTSVDPGVLNAQELVIADNVQYTSTGARIKREALTYLDSGVPLPDYRSSSGTTRTLKWTSNALVNITALNERLVVGEKITITGNSNYNATAVAISSVTAIPQVTSVVCNADIAGSLAGKYFLLSAGDAGTDYYIWYKVSGSGSDPAISNKTGIEVDISTSDTADTIGAATATAVDALSDFAASNASGTITITNAIGGLTTDAVDGNSGFAISVSTKGGHSITYSAGSSVTEALTATGGLMTVSRASSVIMYHDYWRFATDSTEQQIGVFATNDFQLFSLDDAGRRVQIHGQPQISTVVCTDAASLTTGHYFLLNTANNINNYYVWYNIASGGGDPSISGKTAIPVALTGTETADQVASATNTAINSFASADVTSSVSTATLTLTNKAAGTTDGAVEVSTGFTFNITNYGATAPITTVETIRTLVMNERLFIYLSGLGNPPISYNPDDNAKYQLANPLMPDAEFGFMFLGRMWVNDKTNRGRLHYSETFDETLWLGIGDSGAIDIYPGDGDPSGITNAYPYKSMVIVGKKTRRYRVIGDSPENFQVEIVSNGLGNEGPLAVAMDDGDVFFVSRRGFHSQEVTDQYGDTVSAYLSADIKPSFNSAKQDKMNLIQGTYIPELNSVAFSMTESGKQSPNDVWLFNTEMQVPGKQMPGAWYRWPDLSCTAISRKFINGTYKIIFGTSDGRIAQAQTANHFADFDGDGIDFHIKSGTIYPNNDPHTIKAFKRISMIYRPRGNFAFTVKAQIDNQKVQSFSFNEISGLDLLGETFVLGNSILGSSAVLAPFTFSMEGYGRGVTIEISQPTANEQIEVWGFVIEYEPADVAQEADV